MAEKIVKKSIRDQNKAASPVPAVTPRAQKGGEGSTAFRGHTMKVKFTTKPTRKG
jgi:hypothetical protein